MNQDFRTEVVKELGEAEARIAKQERVNAAQDELRHPARLSA